MTIHQPLLKIGSTGEAVRIAQKALNRAPSALSKLTEDGIFGFKTHGRASEFQRKSGLAADGQIGPNTYASLKQWIDAVVPSIVSPQDEEQARDRILQTARHSLQNLGWRPGQDQLGLANPRIAASHAATGTMGSSPFEVAPRQGGAALAAIFTASGVATAPKCLQITGQAFNMYRTPGLPPHWRNTHDIVSWCGIFALYTHRWSGLKVREWPLRFWSQNGGVDDYRVRGASELPKRGDIGRVKTANHFFIVAESPTSKHSQFATIEGNSNLIHPTGVFQTIRSNSRTVADVMADQGGFLEPIWERALAKSPQSSSTQTVGTGSVLAPTPTRFALAR